MSLTKSDASYTYSSNDKSSMVTIVDLNLANRITLIIDKRKFKHLILIQTRERSGSAIQQKSSYPNKELLNEDASNSD